MFNRIQTEYKQNFSKYDLCFYQNQSDEFYFESYNSKILNHIIFKRIYYKLVTSGYQSSWLEKEYKKVANLGGIKFGTLPVP